MTIKNTLFFERFARRFNLWVLALNELKIPIKIKSPKILWPDNDLASRKNYSQEDWDRQRDDSLNNTRISIRFLRNFVDIVEKYLH